MKKERKEEIVKAIFNCSGVVIDDNWITYPYEMEEGYYDTKQNIVECYDNEDTQFPIAYFSMDDLDHAKVVDGAIFVNDFKIQLLVRKEVI